jgi:putative ABC transport system ATP-binding protein
MRTGETVLRLLDVDKKFREPQGVLHVLRRLRLTVRRGEILMITGPSGSGKTTMLQIAGCLIRPTSGSVELAGRELGEASEGERLDARREHLGFVFQNFHLLAALTVAENVSLALRLKRQPIDMGRVLDILEMLGIGSKARKLPKHLSGGEKQRVAIARALVGRPAIVLADEPTGNLDSKTGAAIIELLHELNADGATILMITHDGGLAAQMPRQLHVLDGQIVTDSAARSVEGV